MLGRLYLAAKTRLNVWLQRLINKSHTWVDYSAGIRNKSLQSAVRSLAIATGSVSKLILQLPRIDVTRVAGAVGSVIYVGASDWYKISLLETLFPEGYKEESLGRVFLWKLPTLTSSWLKNSDLVLCRVSKYFPWHISTAYAFQSQLTIEQMLPMDKTMDERLAKNKNLRAQVKKMQKLNFTSRISHSPQDLERFYNQMYLPTAAQRHQERAYTLPYQYFQEAFKSHFLIFIGVDGKDLIGSMSTVKYGIFYGKFLGFEGGTEEQKRELNIALYWHTIEEAHKMNAKKVSFGGSSAWVSNGVFHYKQRWSPKIEYYPNEDEQLLFHAENLSPAWRDHLNKIGFITLDQGKFAQVHLDLPSEGIPEARDNALENGLSGIQIITPRKPPQYVDALSKPPSVEKQAPEAVTTNPTGKVLSKGNNTMRHAYLGVKIKLNIWAQRVYDWSMKQDGRAAIIHNNQLRGLMRWLLLWIADVSKFTLQFPRIEVVQVKSALGRAIYVGDSDITKKAMLERLFRGGYEEVNSDRVNVWKLPKLARQWLTENDLVICRVSRIFPWKIASDHAFDNPLRVQQMLMLDKSKSIDDMFSGGDFKRIRKDIHSMQKLNYIMRISHSMEDLNFFYHRMVIPTAEQRYGDKAYSFAYDYFERVFKKGAIVFLLADGKEVCGDLISVENGILNDHFGGILDGDPMLMEQYIGIAAYWNLIKYGLETGVDKINFLNSNAWVSDGVFFHKQRWGAKPGEDLHCREKVLFRANKLSPQWRDRLNEIGFITRVGNKHLQVCIDLPTAAMQETQASALKNGLDGIQNVTSGQKQNQMGVSVSQLSV